MFGAKGAWLGGTSEAYGASPTCFVAPSGSGPNFNHESRSHPSMDLIGVCGLWLHNLSEGERLRLEVAIYNCYGHQKENKQTVEHRKWRLEISMFEAFSLVDN